MGYWKREIERNQYRTGRRRARTPKRVFGLTQEIRAVFELEAESIREVVKSIQDITGRARERILKTALRDIGKKLQRKVRANIDWRAVQTKRNVIYKVTRYPKGGKPDRSRILWLGVGVRTGLRPIPKRLKGRYGDSFPGWRAHLYEAGFRAWPKGQTAKPAPIRKRQGKYRGGDANRARAILAFVRRDNHWRKGRRGVVGTRHYERRFMRRATMGMQGQIASTLAASINKARNL